jgi:hypothetical protein
LAALFFIVIMALAGLLGALIAGSNFPAPYGGLFGFIIGSAVSVWETIKTPPNLRRHLFSARVGGKYGGGFQQDSRLVTILACSILSALFAILWQFIFYVV